MKILNIVGVRPNFMKMAPIIEAMNKYPDRIQHLLVHTGQHYDEKMSKTFFDDLGMPKPEIPTFGLSRLRMRLIAGDAPKGQQVPEKWDGNAADRIVEILMKMHK